MSIRVSNQIFNNCTRQLPLAFDTSGYFVGSATGVAGIGVDTPATWAHNTSDKSADSRIAMGRAGDDNSVSLSILELVTVSLWVWEPSMRLWIPGGAVASEYQKLPTVAYGKMGFWVPKSQLFYLSASAKATVAWVGGAAADVSYY